MRRGQVTIFIIVAVLISLIGAILIFVLPQSSDIEQSQGEFDTQPLEFQIQQCMQEVGLQNLRLLGQNGNHFEDYFGIRNSTENNETAYWIIQYANVMPILTSSVDDFQLKFNAEFSDCTDFSNLPYDVQEGQPLSKITYGGESVIIELFYPLNVTLDGDTKRYENFNTELNVRYRRMLERGREVIESHFLQIFDYRKPLQLVDQRDFNITYDELDENNLVFTITDPLSYERNQFELVFATNLNRSDLTRTVSMHPDDRQGFMPYYVYSPDRLTQVMIPPNTQVRSDAGLVGEITVNQQYPEDLERTLVTGLTYKIDKGEIKPGLATETKKTWNLTYPVYSFGPDGTRFYGGETGEPTVVPMTFFLDTDKFPFVGPLGLLYRGTFSDGEWRPIRANAEYNSSLITTNIPGFSEFTPVDCNYQQCSEVFITSEQESDEGFMCALSSLLESLVILAIIVIIVAAIFCQLCLSAMFQGMMGALGPGSAAGGVGGVLGAGTGATAASFGSSMLAVTANAAGYLSGLTTVASATTVSAAIIGSYAMAVAVAAGVGMVAVDMMIDDGYALDETAISFVPTCNQIVEIHCTGDADGGYCQVGDKKVQQGGRESMTLDGGQVYKLTAVSEACDDCGDTCSTTGRLVYK